MRSQRGKMKETLAACLCAHAVRRSAPHLHCYIRAEGLRPAVHRIDGQFGNGVRKQTCLFGRARVPARRALGAVSSPNGGY
ncbi:hypothetical protein MTO96_001110 [Rhipicephalus appendiculatus]